MPTPDQSEGDISQTGSPNAEDALLLMLKEQETRIANLESSSKKTPFKNLTEIASVSALFLGLVLTFVSLHDAFWSKPKADRISRISQFNQAINSAAKKRQDLIQAQMQTSDPKLQLALISITTPQILNDIVTAKSMLPDMDDRDITVPQLIILTSEAFSAGDMDSAKNFVHRAVTRSDNTPYLQSEAKRYEGRYQFASGNPIEGRKAYLMALEAIAATQYTQQRGYDLADLALTEYQFGDCKSAETDFQSFINLLSSPYITPDARAQLESTAKSQLAQLQAQRCPTSTRLDAKVDK